MATPWRGNALSPNTFHDSYEVATESEAGDAASGILARLETVLPRFEELLDRDTFPHCVRDHGTRFDGTSIPAGGSPSLSFCSTALPAPSRPYGGSIA